MTKLHFVRRENRWARVFSYLFNQAFGVWLGLSTVGRSVDWSLRPIDISHVASAGTRIRFILQTAERAGPNNKMSSVADWQLACGAPAAGDCPMKVISISFWVRP